MIRFLLPLALLVSLASAAQAYDPCMTSRAAARLNLPDPNDPMLRSNKPEEAAAAQKRLADATAYHAAAQARYDACAQSAAQAKRVP
jgi:hypothetical protein